MLLYNNGRRDCRGDNVYAFYKIEVFKKKRNLSQQYMADFLGITRQGCGKYEDGKSEPDSKSIVKLADFFDVTTDYLLGNTNNPEYKFDSLAEMKKIVEEYEIQGIFIHNIEDWENLTDEDIRELRSHFEYIAHKAKLRKKIIKNKGGFNLGLVKII